MLEWDDRYSVGISVIDKEHKKLFSIIDKTIYAKEHSDNSEELKEALKEVLEEMTKYALKHFVTEETYMREFNYQEYQYHKKEHYDFFDETLVYFEKVVNEANDISNEIHKYLKQWLVNHIQGTDKKYIDCFTRNGLK